MDRQISSMSSDLTTITQPIKGTFLTTSINVDKNTDEPDKAWSILQLKMPNLIEPIEPLKLDTPIYEDKVRIVCISDTHMKMAQMHHEIPSGDVLIHAGDFTSIGSIGEVRKFAGFLTSLNQKFKYKVVIAGNHELSFDKPDCNSCYHYRNLIKNGDLEKEPRDLLNDCIYLEDSYVRLFGLKIYGAPWQPRFANWAFNVDRGEKILEKWNLIPDNTDILITHGPPLGFGDIIRGGYHVGCAELLSTIQQRVKPKLHVFGHIHENPGLWTDGTTKYANASICNIRYIPENPPILIDIDLPPGFTKQSFSV